jgi:hypothetical protein
MEHDYRTVLAASQRVAWAIDDVLPEGARLDSSRPFLPDSLAGVEALRFLSASERRALNHIRGHSYLALFGLVEEFILPFVLDHARARLGVDPWETRALLQFAEEEAKHIHLFERFGERFAADLEMPCAVIGPASGLAEAILSHHPLGVGLAVLHIEWMTQRHYVGSIRGDDELDPLFASLLEHHWMEEAQHALLDTFIVEGLASTLGPTELRRGLDDYARIGTILDDGLLQQVELDLESLERAIGRELPATERAAVREAQQRAYRRTFLESGATHPRFVATHQSLARRC